MSYSNMLRRPNAQAYAYSLRLVETGTKNMHEIEIMKRFYLRTFSPKHRISHRNPSTAMHCYLV